MTDRTPPTTLTEIFFGAVDRYSSKRAALRFKANGHWQDVTHHEVARAVHHAALGLRELGVERGAHIGILSQNRPEWTVADFASLTLGCTDVPIYPTLPAQQIAYILRDAGIRTMFVENADQLAKLETIRDDVPDLEHIIVFDYEPDMVGAGIHPYKDVLRQGQAHEAKYPTYRADALAVQPDDIATLIYTSGTTGPPKGVMLTHGNFTSNVVSALTVLQLSASDSCLSLLPLSHSFERMAGHYTMIQAGVTINYAEGIDEVPANLLEVRPTIVLSVPRLFEKIFARVLDNATAGGAVKRRMFFWARRNAERWADLKLAGQAIPGGLAFKKAIADRLVFSKLRARTGDRVRFFVSGGAPLNPDIAKFFYAAGLPILEGYGLTETSPVIAVNSIEELRLGSVGRPLPGVDVRIAEDGEILARGPNVMLGYYNKPDATRDAVDADGWFHTGDVGELDDGFLRITDRKKDIIVTAGGKNIAPQPIENKAKANAFVLNAVVIGDRRPFPSMLVVPDQDAVKKWAGKRNLTIDPADLLKMPDVVAKIETEVMGTLRDFASYEMPKKLLLLEEDFTIEGGELTPTLKVKRRVVEKKFQARIDALYEG